MKKREFMELVKSVVVGSPNAFNGDIPAIRGLFCDMVDSYHKCGELSDSQAQKWVLTDRELNKLKRISK